MFVLFQFFIAYYFEGDAYVGGFGVERGSYWSALGMDEVYLRMVGCCSLRVLNYFKSR
jgi:hypothetical protein